MAERRDEDCGLWRCGLEFELLWNGAIRGAECLCLGENRVCHWLLGGSYGE
jgi:hypothetical protein